MIALLVNAGSSSLKLSVLDFTTGEELARASAEFSRAEGSYEVSVAGNTVAEGRVQGKHREAVDKILTELRRRQPQLLSDPASLFGVGHRVVHGGNFTSAVRIDVKVKKKLAELCELAPLHNPPSLEALAAAESALPEADHFAIFDTSFHSSMPEPARLYAVPRHWQRNWNIRRYGFHGLSHAYCAGRAAEMLGRSDAADLRIIVCHLGNGCSASAVRGGRCIDTTMGFTPLEGLVMGTRCGNIDAGVVLHVIERRGLSADEVSRVLNKESGLLGLSGVSSDMREVIAAAESGNDDARGALELYAYRVRQALGALSAALNGLDALVFTAGVGENAAAVRADICRGLDYLGVELDEGANNRAKPDCRISAAGSPVHTLVIGTREDLEMLREMKKVKPAK